MGGFLESEKIRQTEFKLNSDYFSDDARQDGMYKGKPRAFCLPIKNAQQNLFPEIRSSISEFFVNHQIKWHDGQDGKPSNHLCDSQVCCVNFLAPLADKPLTLKMILEPVFPEIKQMLPIEDDRFVSFEWIGEKNYLGERVTSDKQRTRGANCTSADAVVMFESKDNERHIVLIEWKYTESYTGFFLKYSINGTDRTSIYRHLFDAEDCPIDKKAIPGFDSLFYEPFYQFMRQQFLANEMEKAHEMGADRVSVLHIAPAHNRDFRKITSPGLGDIGKSATGVWKKLVKAGDRFISTSTEQIFGHLNSDALPEIKMWIDYIYSRYPWVIEE